MNEIDESEATDLSPERGEDVGISPVESKVQLVK